MEVIFKFPLGNFIYCVTNYKNFYLKHKMQENIFKEVLCDFKEGRKNIQFFSSFVLLIRVFTVNI